MEQSKKQKITIYFVISTSFLVLVLALFFRPEFFGPIWQSGQERPAEEAEISEEKLSESLFFDPETGETDQLLRNEEKSLLKSENYKIRQIAFGGSAVAAADNSKEIPASVANLESEAMLSSDNKEAKLLVSWDTNKEVLSAVEYSRSDGQSPKKISESRYSSSHRLVLSGLDPGAVYVYRIKSRDRWGQEFASEFYSVYSGSPAVSVFDLISRSMNDLFGWAIKK